MPHTGALRNLTTGGMEGDHEEGLPQRGEFPIGGGTASAHLRRLALPGSLVNDVSGLNYATTTIVASMIAGVYNWLSTTYLESGLNYATTTIVASKLASVHNWLSRRI